MMIKDILYIAGFVVAMLASVYLIVTMPHPGVHVIDCRIAEISPDIPVDAKQACRRANMEKIK